MKLFVEVSDLLFSLLSLSVHNYLYFSLHFTDADRARKHGMDEFIHSNPCNFDHAALLELLQHLTLDHRLNDSYSCLVSFILCLCLWGSRGMWLCMLGIIFFYGSFIKDHMTCSIAQPNVNHRDYKCWLPGHRLSRNTRLNERMMHVY